MSIAAMVDDALVAGVVVDLVHDLTYHAALGGGAWCDDRPLRVSTITEPVLALVGAGLPFKSPASERIDEYLGQFRRILRQVSGFRRAASAALDLAHVAEGRLDGFWEIGLARWDVAAGLLLVQEAGGHITDVHCRIQSRVSFQSVDQVAGCALLVITIERQAQLRVIHAAHPVSRQGMVVYQHTTLDMKLIESYQPILLPS